MIVTRNGIAAPRTPDDLVSESRSAIRIMRPAYSQKRDGRAVYCQINVEKEHYRERDENGRAVSVRVAFEACRFGRPLFA